MPEPDIVQDHVSFDLAYNYYPTTKSLIKNLNDLTLQNMRKFIATKETDIEIDKIFTLDEATRICSFTSTARYSVQLSPYLLNVLQLYNTYESNTAKGAMRLLFAIHTFCIYIYIL